MTIIKYYLNLTLMVSVVLLSLREISVMPLVSLTSSLKSVISLSTIN